MTADADKPKKSRWRLSGLRGKKSTDPMEIDSHDSTYGGSDASAAGNANETSASLNTNESNAPSSTTTQAQQTSPREGQGTVVETTTTTTTITRTFAGGTQEQKVEETRRDDTGQLLERKPIENTSSENMPPENTSSIDKFQGTPDTAPGRETNSFRDGPSPTGPGKTNYSYPRNPHSGGEGRSGGTFEGLKTAAAGIHGAGEALRGTLNSAVDKRFDPNPEVSVAKHEEVTARGRQEIDTGHLNHAVREPNQAKKKGILRKPLNDVR